MGRNHLFAAFYAFALLACSSTGDAGGGASNLPVSGAGPFLPIEPSEQLSIDAPFVLETPGDELDEPTAVPWDQLIALWCTVRDSSGAITIQHADVTTTLLDGFGTPYPAIQPDQGWEAGAVTGPSIVWSGPGTTEWLLFYAGGGAIGYAIGTDALGHVWRKPPGPALRANEVEEGHVLGPPAAVHVPSAAGEGDRLRVYYVASGAIWAADAPYADVLAGNPVEWTRLDGDPTTPARDPMIAPSQVPFAASLGRVQARAALTPAGRVRHDLYFTAIAPANTMPATTVGFASSFTGDRFEVAPAPILPPKLVTKSPSVIAYADDVEAGFVLFYAAQHGAHTAIAAARSP